MDWQSYLEISDESLQELRSVGFLYVQQGCYDIALDIFIALSILSPGNSYDLQTIGTIYLEKSKYPEALEYLDKAIKIDPKNNLIILNMAKTLLSLGYKAEGIAQAKIVAESKDPKFAIQAAALINANI